MKKNHGIIFAILFLLSSLSAACSKSVDERLMDYKQQLEPHVHFIFTAVTEASPSNIQADMMRVRDVHRIAELVELYHEKTGSYPLSAEKRQGFVQVVLRNPTSPYPPVQIDEYNVDPQLFKKELQDILGPVVIPFDNHDPESQKFMDYSYACMGANYIVATYLKEQPHYAEQVTDDTVQYRVGSEEDENLPILSFTKLLAGDYNKTPSKKYIRGN